MAKCCSTRPGRAWHWWDPFGIVGDDDEPTGVATPNEMKMKEAGEVAALARENTALRAKLADQIAANGMPGAMHVGSTGMISPDAIRQKVAPNDPLVQQVNGRELSTHQPPVPQPTAPAAAATLPATQPASAPAVAAVNTTKPKAPAAAAAAPASQYAYAYEYTEAPAAAQPANEAEKADAEGEHQYEYVYQVPPSEHKYEYAYEEQDVVQQPPTSAVPVTRPTVVFASSAK